MPEVTLDSPSEAVLSPGLSTPGYQDDAPKQNGISLEDISFGGEGELQLDEVFQVATAFYKDKAHSKAVSSGYSETCQLVALWKQATRGDCEETNNVGFLNVVGQNRRDAWVQLRGVSKEDAMDKFVRMLATNCPTFKPYLTAYSLKQQQLQQQNEEIAARQQATMPTLLSEVELSAAAQQQQLREFLNQQTAAQFTLYAEQQYPGEREKQDELIRQLREQHFQQYMQQLYMAGQQQQQQVPQNNHHVDLAQPQMSSPNSEPLLGTLEVEDSEDDEGSDTSTPPLLAPQIWSQKNLAEFKAAVTKESSENVLKIGSGETVTIRVPTHDEANSVFWEFSTDSYDIGFGVYFEWSYTPDERVTVHVSDSEGEGDDLDDEGKKAGPAKEPKPEIEGDVENRAKKPNDGPPIDELLPICRRDSHIEVVCGSHLYPASRGVYLLKFDNSYSLWRSKKLYYRIYYSKS